MPLIIGQTKINYLSGPNQMFYLQPLQNVSPLILFGDVHFSGKNQCNPSEHEYKLYSDDFLKLLDTLPFTVNLYVESWLRKADYPPNKKTFSYFKNVGDLDQLIPALRFPRMACYIKELRGTELYSTYCPTKNLNWHHIDARFAEHLQITKSGSYKTKSIFTEYKAFLSYNALEALTKCKSLTEKELTYNIFTTLTFEEYIEGLEILKLFLGNPNTLFETLLNNSNSIINKQIKKINFNITVKMLTDFYKDIYLKQYDLPNETVLIDFISTLQSFLKVQNTENYQNVISMLFNDTDDKDGWSIRKYIIANRRQLMKLTSIIVDLYFSFRLLKKDHSELTIGVAGLAHIDNCVSFLTQYLKAYRIETKIIGEYTGDTETAQRCLEMPDINLNTITKMK